MAFQVICGGEYNDTLIMGILPRMCSDGVYVCMHASCEGRCVRACVLPIFPHLHANIHTTTRTHTNTHAHAHTHTCTCSHTHITTQPCAYIQSIHTKNHSVAGTLGFCSTATFWNKFKQLLIPLLKFIISCSGDSSYEGLARYTQVKKSFRSLV